jgi:hypothetical protein
VRAVGRRDDSTGWRYNRAVETRNRHLRELAAWYDQWCNPVVNAMYREDASLCRSALAAARAELALDKLSADDTLALALQLHYLEFQVCCNIDSGGVDLPTAWRRLLRALEAEPRGQMSALMRDCLRLIAYVLGDTRGHLALDEARMDELFARIPERDLDAELWYYISSWAVEHRNRHYIQLAYGEMLTEPTGYLRHDIWLRVNLMYLIMEGRARERDVLEAVRVYKHPNQLKRFNETLWPLVIEAGLDTPLVAEAIAAKRAELDSAPLTPPSF